MNPQEEKLFFVILLLLAWDAFFPAHPVSTWPAELDRMRTRLPARVRACPPAIQMLALFLIITGVINLLDSLLTHGPLSPFQGSVAMIVDLALSYGVLCRKRFVFYILIFMTGLGMVVALGKMLIFTIIWKAATAVLLYQARNDFHNPPDWRAAAR